MLNGSSGTLQDAFTLVVSWTVLSPATKRGFLGPLSPIVWGSEQCILILFKYALLCVCFFCGTTVPCFPTLHSAYVDLKSSGRKSPPPPPPFKGSERTSCWRHVRFTKGKNQKWVCSVVGQTPVYGKWVLSELMRKMCVLVGGGGGGGGGGCLES